LRETILLEIKGMHCPDCPSKVERTLNKLKGINQVTVDYEVEQGCITYNQHLISIQDLESRISELGFEARNIKTNAK
jgi:copper chaperone CopZ